MLELNDTRRLKYKKTCDRISSPQKYYFLWMADFMFNDDTTPVWVGFFFFFFLIGIRSMQG